MLAVLAIALLGAVVTYAPLALLRISGGLMIAWTLLWAPAVILATVMLALAH